MFNEHNVVIALYGVRWVAIHKEVVIASLGI